jgi:hypothetical protein
MMPAKAVEAKDTESSASENGANEKASDKASIMFGVPSELKRLLDGRAEAEDISVAALVRNLVAREFNYTLPKVTRERAKKYATEEERTAAQKARMSERNATIKALLEKYRKGEITLDGSSGN